MAYYQVVSTGATIIAEQSFMDQYHAGDYVLTSAVYTTDFVGCKITPRAFFQRFGQSNLLWLYQQLATNPALMMYKDMVMSSDFVDLADPVTAADLAYLLTLVNTPFTSAVITDILSSPVLQSELPS